GYPGSTKLPGNNREHARKSPGEISPPAFLIESKDSKSRNNRGVLSRSKTEIIPVKKMRKMI
ncbi:MAG: hypothetical protein U9N73_00475, partial [Candidatus Auribacterota bacterium]|nr:hypothetical protein [Candidatus Auribacterota bacterium]